ncbi:MAG: 16S rRNA (adenine(1518)-N(6)/adenine(1519)-N(6))-dimethyltransferase RsmA [Actinomycetota bacterium]|nr:16S rRNA (adenine(1518)-N(6)/adenine(1519)-N(6))-dimethyltransferase RsmA [Actinomycetota bacterium]
MTAPAVRRLLEEHHLALRRSSGQNFVVDPNTVRKIVRDARVGPDDVVLEIGPGLGSLTLALADHARRVVTVEIDAGLVRALHGVLGDRPDVEIVHADALHVDFDELLAGPGRLLANLPYNVATPIVFRALHSGAITDLFVMVQREVGERWAAHPADALYSGVSVKLRLVADVEVIADVPRTVFYPIPNVDSVTVRVARRDDAPLPAERAAIVEVVDLAFAQRRKMLRNSLRSLADRERLAAAFAAAGIDPSMRPEELPAAAFRRLAAELAGPSGGRVAAAPTTGTPGSRP